MTKKLQDLGSDFADSDMLVDFVSVMLENNKTKPQIYQELIECEFIILGPLFIFSDESRGSSCIC